MNETPMLFPITPSEFWKQIKIVIQDAIAEKLSQQKISQTNSHLPEKTLLKASDVCEIFQVSKPTLYEWLKQKKLKSFKIKSRPVRFKLSITRSGSWFLFFCVACVLHLSFF